MSKESKSYYRRKYLKKNSTSIKEKSDKTKIIRSIKELVYNGKLNKALAEIEAYLEKYQNDSYGLFQKANILIYLDKLDEAEEIYREIIDMELDSKYSSIYKLGVINQIKGDKEKAEEYYRMNIETSPYPEVYSRIELAKLQAIKGNYDSAFKLLDGYYDKNVDGLDEISILLNYDIKIKAKNRLKIETAMLKYVCNDLEGAKNYLEEVELGYNEPNDREYYLLMGKIARKEDEDELSLEYLQKALSGPRGELYWKSMLEIANTKNKLNESETAINICDIVIKNNLKTNMLLLVAYKIKGDAYASLGEYEKAREVYSQANCVDKNVYEGYYNMGKLEYYLKNYNTAIEFFDKYKCETFVGNNDGNFYKMLSLLKLGRYDEAYLISKKVHRNLLSSIKKREYYFANIYLKNKLGIIQDDEILDTYTHNQIINYNLEETIKHSSRMHEKDGNISVFNENVDIESLILSVPDLLKRDDVIIAQNLFIETYDIPLEGLGKQNGKDTNMLKVVMLPEKNKIITMFPFVSSAYAINKDVKVITYGIM